MAECARNIAVTGARPLGLTNCLNFGDPNKPDAYWQLAESVRGLGEAALALGIPVTGGNVSLYNESPLGRIAPTAQIGVVGVLDDIDDLVRPQFSAAGDVVVLLGETGPGMAGSAYERLAGAAPDDRPPSLDLDARGRAARAAARRRRGSRAQVRPGRQRRRPRRGRRGVRDLVAALARTCSSRFRSRRPSSLFGESPSRAVVTIDEHNWSALARLASSRRIAARRLGVVGGDRLRIRLVGVGATGAAEERGAGVADELDVSLDELRRAWTQALPRVLGKVA